MVRDSKTILSFTKLLYIAHEVGLGYRISGMDLELISAEDKPKKYRFGEGGKQATEQ